MTPECAPTARQTSPERDRVGGIGRNGRHSREQERGESKKASAASYGIHDTSYQRCPKEQRGIQESEFCSVQ